MNEDTEDEFLWLEEIDGGRATAWVAAQNAATSSRLRDARFDQDQATLRALYDAEDRIPAITRRGAHVYNLWTDAAHQRGLWRRTSLASYRTDTPVWETILDLDALGAAEGESWVWAGSSWLPGNETRVLISLSRGGADASVTREFDLTTRSFVAGGFHIPEAKGGAAWVDADTLLVTSAHGGDVTTSGYARTIRRWPRGTPLEAAPVTFSVDPADLAAHAGIDHDPAHPHTLYIRTIDFFRRRYTYDSPTHPQRKLDLPEDCDAETGHGLLLLRPRTDWTIDGATYGAGSLLAIDIDAFLAGSRAFTRLFTPAPRLSLAGWLNLRTHLVLETLDNVRSRILIADPATGETRTIPNLPEAASIHTQPLAPSDPEAEDILLWVSSFLEPDRLMLGRADTAPEPLKSRRPAFDPAGLAARQYEATAADGTAIPYFWIGPETAPPPGGFPTHLTGYGGFEIPLTPHYMGEAGLLWLAQGNASVIANLRGGGEFGPAWHQAGIRENKRTAQDDLAAVAADLAARGLTSPARLLAAGGSNGGLLVGNMLARHPGLFGAILCTVPLLDMKRYTRLLAGASWIAEYGDPDTPDWTFLSQISPYHLIKPGQPYPPILLATTRRDDRVHPAHARKTAARLQAMGYDALYYEQPEGGHGSGADSTQRAFLSALFYAFHRATIARPRTDQVPNPDASGK